MSKQIKVIILLLMISFFGNKVSANYEKLAYDFQFRDLDGNKIIGQKALEITIELAIEAGKMATKFLKAPHDLEYEKTFIPFALLSKKRYVGMLYEEDIEKCYRKSMGIVLKRRDNAPIVKDVYGGIIDILMKEKDVKLAMNYLDNMLKKIINKDIQMDKLIISKSLRAFYKNPKTIAHKVLADRISERDPGNNPSPVDRIQYSIKERSDISIKHQSFWYAVGLESKALDFLR